MSHYAPKLFGTGLGQPQYYVASVPAVHLQEQIQEISSGIRHKAMYGFDSVWKVLAVSPFQQTSQSFSQDRTKMPYQVFTMDVYKVIFERVG